jgi:hypothetical protein
VLLLETRGEKVMDDEENLADDTAEDTTTGDEQLIGYCTKCIHYIPHFKICMDTPIHVFDMEEPPEEHLCRRGFIQSDGTPNPYKQMSLAMVDNIKRTHFEFEFDEEKWIKDVHVKGLPHRSLEVSIPKEMVVFSFYNTETSRLRYDLRPDLPSVVICSVLTAPSMETRLKSWNGYPSSRTAPAIVLPFFVRNLGYIYRTMLYRESFKTHPTVDYLERDGFENFIKFWKRMGYQAGFETTSEGVLLPYVAYRLLDRYNFVFIPKNMMQHFRETVKPKDTGDREMLEKFHLGNKCPLCGIEYIHKIIIQPCEFCHKTIVANYAFPYLVTFK